MKEKGILPSLADLEACQRVGQHELALFNELAGALTGQLCTQFQGKISTLTAENRILEGRLFHVQAELNAQWDIQFFSFPQDNWALMEELAKLKSVQERLDTANAEAAKQRQKLERHPEAEKERDEAKQIASEAEAREKELRARLEELTAANQDLLKWFATTSIDGFQSCLNLTAVLAPRVNFKFFDDMHSAREGKIYLGDKVLYDPADHLSEAEEEDEDSPANAFAADGDGAT